MLKDTIKDEEIIEKGIIEAEVISPKGGKYFGLSGEKGKLYVIE